MSAPTITIPAGSKQYWGHTVSSLQTGVTVNDGAITGTLKYVSSGALVDTWGAGNFMALKFNSDDWTDYTSVKVGMDPSQGSGLVEILTDPDKDGVFKVTNKSTQKFVIVATDGTYTVTKVYDLSGLTCEAE